jgi:hypothetical protein
VVKAPTPAAPLAANWQDWPLTPGDWALRQDTRGSIALFGPTGREALFMIRCDIAARAIYLSRAGAIPGGGEAKMLIRASTAAKDYPALSNSDTPVYAAAKLTPRDPQLDAAAFSRGRFVVSVTGLPNLVIPAWPEFTRVVEDCRG